MDGVRAFDRARKNPLDSITGLIAQPGQPEGIVVDGTRGLCHHKRRQNGILTSGIHLFPLATQIPTIVKFKFVLTEGDLLWGSISIFLCSSQYASTHHGAQQGRQPAGHLTCVRHGTYLRGGTGV
ncbi:hypothetical protein TNCV_2986931 [Trichonephila clavipes]|nr:hypothetical protein TNCV_2986931 [Trichonephila clavipes]